MGKKELTHRKHQRAVSRANRPSVAKTDVPEEGEQTAQKASIGTSGLQEGGKDAEWKERQSAR